MNDIANDPVYRVRRRSVASLIPNPFVLPFFVTDVDRLFSIKRFSTFGRFSGLLQVRRPVSMRRRRQGALNVRETFAKRGALLGDRTGVGEIRPHPLSE